MKIPLHLRPDDYTPAGCMTRYDLLCDAMWLNPRGFRVAGKKRGITKSDYDTRAARLAKAATGDLTALATFDRTVIAQRAP